MTRTTRASRRIAPAKPKIRRSPTLLSARRRGRSKPDPPAAPIGRLNTISCCALKRSSAPQPRTPAKLRCELSMHKVVLLRHGESTWNRENRFTGWTDVDLSDKGREEAGDAGRLLKEGGYAFDLAYTSVLKRAIRTLGIALDALDLLWIPVVKDWRLNERHYGALQGLNKAETAARHGEAQTKIWRRSYDIPPPPLTEDDPRHPSRDPRYAHLSSKELPLTE